MRPFCIGCKRVVNVLTMILFYILAILTQEDSLL